jgi:imidazolonepropionase-like amidohydrolase
MKIGAAVLLAVLSGLTVSCASAADVAPAADGVVALVDVNVVPMDDERVIANQTVIVRGGRIAEIGPADATNVPADATEIDGSGKYLMPGMAEMHGHIPSPDQPAQLVEDVLFLYVANGVTTVRGMQGAEGQLQLRERVLSGELMGPHLYLAGPGFNGRSAATPEQAAERVRQQKDSGWHLLKVQGGLTVPAYDAMAATAKEVGIRFGGHVPADVGLLHAIDRGQETFEHLDGYVEYVAPDGTIDEAKLGEVVRLTREAGAWVVPTMALWEVLRGALDVETVRAYAETRYMPPEMVEQWTSRVESIHAAPDFDPEAARQLVANRMRILRELHEGGVGILAGTDAPQVFSVPGFSMHREMQRMVDAGMTPYEVVRSATRNVGEYFSNEDDFGTIAVGRRADLLLVDGNPLEDVANIARRTGVLVHGRWLPESDIQTRLTRIAETHAE